MLGPHIYIFTCRYTYTSSSTRSLLTHRCWYSLPHIYIVQYNEDRLGGIYSCPYRQQHSHSSGGWHIPCWHRPGLSNRAPTSSFGHSIPNPNHLGLECWAFWKGIASTQKLWCVGLASHAGIGHAALEGSNLGTWGHDWKEAFGLRWLTQLHSSYCTWVQSSVQELAYAVNSVWGWLGLAWVQWGCQWVVDKLPMHSMLFFYQFHTLWTRNHILWMRRTGAVLGFFGVPAFL